MSADSCYQCGSRSHKFYQCKETVNPAIKQMVKTDHQMAQPRDPNKSLQKWHHRLAIKSEPPLPAFFLKKEVLRYIDLLQEWNSNLDQIGTPCLGRDELECKHGIDGHLMDQRFKLHKLHDGISENWSQIRSLIAAIKAYLISVKTCFTDEDEIMATYMEDLDLGRRPFHNRLAKMLVNVKDADKYGSEFKAAHVGIIHELDQINQQMTTARPMTNEMLDKLFQDVIRTENGTYQQLQEDYAYLQGICDPESIDWIFAAVLGAQQFIAEVKQLIQQKRALIFEDMSQQGNCQVCFDRKNEIAYMCGHQLCQPCHFEVQNSPEARRRCPFCRGPIDRFIALIF